MLFDNPYVAATFILALISVVGFCAAFIWAWSGYFESGVRLHDTMRRLEYEDKNREAKRRQREMLDKILRPR